MIFRTSMPSPTIGAANSTPASARLGHISDFAHPKGSFPSRVNSQQEFHASIQLVATAAKAGNPEYASAATTEVASALDEKLSRDKSNDDLSKSDRYRMPASNTSKNNHAAPATGTTITRPRTTVASTSLNETSLAMRKNIAQIGISLVQLRHKFRPTDRSAEKRMGSGPFADRPAQGEPTSKAASKRPSGWLRDQVTTADAPRTWVLGFRYALVG